MGRHTRLFVFPGGLLEVADYGDENDSRGVYLELRTPADHVLPQRVPDAAVMNQDISSADAETCAKVLRLLRDLS